MLSIVILFLSSQGVSSIEATRSTASFILNHPGNAPQQRYITHGLSPLQPFSPQTLPSTRIPTNQRHQTPKAHESKSALQSSTIEFELKPDKGLTYDPDGPRITFSARKTHGESVLEKPNHRTLLEYLALPAEKYSVLDAGTIERNPEDKNAFTCTLDPIQFLGNTLIAKIEATVHVSPFPEGKSVIRVTGCTLEGSRLARFANGSFDVDCTNVVRALVYNPNNTTTTTTTNSNHPPPTKNNPILHVDCNLIISALVPREGRWLPKRLLGKSGSIVMQQMLNLLVPRFVKQLTVDFDAWSAGDDSRSPVAGDSGGEEESEEEGEKEVEGEGEGEEGRAGSVAVEAWNGDASNGDGVNGHTNGDANGEKATITATTSVKEEADEEVVDPIVNGNAATGECQTNGETLEGAKRVRKRDVFRRLVSSLRKEN